MPATKEDNILINPDFSETQDDLTPGEYRVRVTGVEQKTSKAGADYLRWELTTFGSADPKNDGRKTWYTTMLSGKGAGMLKKFFKTCTGEELESNFDTEQLLSREIVVIMDQDDQGYMNVKAIKPIQ